MLCTVSIPLLMRIVELADDIDLLDELQAPADGLGTDTHGFGYRNVPISANQRTLTIADDHLRYIPLQYPHCYIDLTWTFEQYAAKFSSKTRSTLQRKIRKFEKYCGGELVWKTYTGPDAIPGFFELARRVSSLTYQERLLNVGLPDSDSFLQESVELAKGGLLRAFILFHGERPVSYLYCPARNNVLTYAYLGYDPEYSKWSPGTILQWLAIEQIFEERRFRYFDFTEGRSSHKELFASHQRQCANVFFLKRTIRNYLLVYLHLWANGVATCIGSIAERLGVKAMIKKLLRKR